MCSPKTFIFVEVDIEKCLWTRNVGEWIKNKKAFPASRWWFKLYHLRFLIAISTLTRLGSSACVAV